MKFDNTYNLSVKYEKLSKKQNVSKVADFIGDKLNKFSQSQDRERMFYSKLSWYKNMFQGNAGNDLYQFILNSINPKTANINGDNEKVILQYSKDIYNLFTHVTRIILDRENLLHFGGLLGQCITYADKKYAYPNSSVGKSTLKNILGVEFGKYETKIKSLISDIRDFINNMSSESVDSDNVAKQNIQTVESPQVSSYVKEKQSYFSDPKVGEIQKLLNSRGEKLKVDNIYGPQTAATLQRVLTNSGRESRVASAEHLNEDNSSILETYINVLNKLPEKGVIQAASKIEMRLKKYAQSFTDQLMSRLRWFENTFADTSGNSFKAFIQNETNLKSDSRDQYFANSKLINSYVKVICDLFKNKGLANKSSQPNAFIPEFKDFIDYVITSSSSDKFSTGNGDVLTLQEYIKLHNGNYDKFISILSELRNSMINWVENYSNNKPVFNPNTKYTGPFYSSNSVAKLQGFLGINPDGQYGPKTYFAVNKLLRVHGLTDSAMTPESLYDAANADDYIKKYIKLFEDSIETLNA